jgi:enoyl-CoA hydratase/carnithine racemase
MSTIRQRLNFKVITPGYWRITIDNPPINLYDPEMFAELRALMDRIDSDPDLKVVVFDSANPDYFVAHYDVVRGEHIPRVPGAAEFSRWREFVTRLTHPRVASTAAKLKGCGAQQ